MYTESSKGKAKNSFRTNCVQLQKERESPVGDSRSNDVGGSLLTVAAAAAASAGGFAIATFCLKG